MKEVIKGQTEINWEHYFMSFETNEQIDACLESIDDGFIKLAALLQRALPKGRHKSLVLTNLEEAHMFAIKSLTHTNG